MQRIRADALAVAITRELSEYSQEVTERLKEEVLAAAKRCVEEIKMKAQENIKKDGSLRLYMKATKTFG